MKKRILFLILFIILLFLPKPNYIELNHLAIIDSVKITCSDDYTLEIREVIPTKSDNGIEKDYKKYSATCKELNICLEEIKNTTSKKIYYQGVKKIKTNCHNRDEVIRLFRDLASSQS